MLFRSVHKALDAFDGVPLPVQRAAEAALQPYLPGELYEGWLDGPALSFTDQPCIAFDLERLMIVPPLFKALVPALLHAFAVDSAGGHQHLRDSSSSTISGNSIFRQPP